MTDDIKEVLFDFVSPSILWGVLAVIVLTFSVISVALTYHWKNYNVNSAVAKRLVRIYFVVSVGLLFIMLISVISYST